MGLDLWTHLCYEHHSAVLIIIIDVIFFIIKINMIIIIFIIIIIDMKLVGGILNFHFNKWRKVGDIVRGMIYLSPIRSQFLFTLLVPIFSSHYKFPFVPIIRHIISSHY